MPDKISLKVEKRKITGRKVKKLRRDKIVPANIYGKGIKSLAVQVPLKDFHQAFKKAGETNVVYLSIKGEKSPRAVLIHNIHRHPVTDYYLHADFYQVDLTKKVSVAIPIEIIGEAPAVNQGGVLVQLKDEVEVEALPTELPDKFTVDVSKLEEIGQGISLKNLKIDKSKVTLLTENLEEPIVQIEEPTKEEEKPEPAPEEALTEEEKGEPKEGESKESEPKEGESKETKPKAEEPKKEEPKK